MPTEFEILAAALIKSAVSAEDLEVATATLGGLAKRPEEPLSTLAKSILERPDLQAASGGAKGLATGSLLGAAGGYGLVSAGYDSFDPPPADPKKREIWEKRKKITQLGVGLPVGLALGALLGYPVGRNAGWTSGSDSLMKGLNSPALQEMKSVSDYNLSRDQIPPLLRMFHPPREVSPSSK